jgi:hypothetical protein
MNMSSLNYRFLLRSEVLSSALKLCSFRSFVLSTRDLSLSPPLHECFIKQADFLSISLHFWNVLKHMNH